MADAVTTRTLFEDMNYLVVQLTGVSDGTGEAAVTKVDKSTFTASDGAEPDSLDIVRVDFAVTGYSARLLWDHTTDDMAIVLSGTGTFDFSGAKTAMYPNNIGMRPSPDPRSSGGTGDILLTTPASASTGTYTIVLYLVKRAS